MSSSQGFESGPSIVELFYSAKKLLSLQPRVENRHLRKDNSKTQRQILASSKGESHKNHELNNRNKVLDLLSPLSLDDLKNSPPYTQKSPTVASTTESTTKTSSTLSTSVTRRASVNSQNNMGTPTSMQNDSSPRPSESKRLSISSTKNNDDTKVAAKNTIRSNLTSSLKSETNQPNQSTANPVKPTECHNCHTLKTPLWRKDPQGNTLCNACGLFLKLHGTTRPLSLKTDVIKKRSSKRVTTGNPKLPGSIPMSISSPGSHSSSLSRSNSFSSRISIAPSDPNVNRIKFNPTYTGGSVNIMAGASNPAAGQQSSVNSRLKNVLILPKPAAGTTLNGQTNSSPFSASSSTPNTPGGSFNSRSIPIPNGSRISPSPPYNASGSYSFGKQSLHPFKRKKSEINIASRDFYDILSSNPSSFVKRGVSSAGLSNSFNEYNENHVSTVRNSSYLSSSLNRRASEKNFTHMQQSSRNNSAVSNSLTSSNMSLFNQRFTNSNNTYFDTAPGQLSRHNSTSTLMMNNLSNHDEYVETPAANIASTPTSVTSQSSFAIQAGHRPSKANSEWLSRGNKGPMFTAGAQSDTSSSIPATPSNDMMATHGMDTHMDEILHSTDINMRLETDQSFFNKYTSIEGFANGERSRASSTTGASPKTANAAANEGFTQAQSSLTQGLKSQLENHNNINNDAKDLEWLKFEL